MDQKKMEKRGKARKNRKRKAGEKETTKKPRRE